MYGDKKEITNEGGKDMSKSLMEFKRFIKDTEAQLTEYEKKIIEIILNNFSMISTVGSPGGKRGKLLADLITRYDDSKKVDFVFNDSRIQAEEGQFIRLSKLIVKNFRGFTNEIVLEFKNPYTFVYGPNGTGKSSLCESLEYSLLGTIHEAEAKRIDIGSYIKNVNTGKADQPILKGIDINGKEFSVKADPNNNQFCFVERNRIEGFSRVSANTPQAQQLRLAALFGLEEFNNFVINFNEKLDNYLDCVGEKAEQLAIKRKEVMVHTEHLESIPGEKDIIDCRISLLLSNRSGFENIDELKRKILGDEDSKGTIQKNNIEIAKLEVLKKITDPGIHEFLEDAKRLNSLVLKQIKAQETLMTYKDELSLKDMYVAILQNKEKYKDYCPACESELYIEGNLVVPKNPFSHAEVKIKEFEAAIKLENELLELDSEINKDWPLLGNTLFQILKMAESINFSNEALIGTLYRKVLEDKENEQRLNDLTTINVCYDDVWLDLIEQHSKYNREVEVAEERINVIKTENSELEGVLEEIAAITATKKSLDDRERVGKKAILKFDQVNKELIEQAEQEKSKIERNKKYNDAYISFKLRLEKYNRQLPTTLAANLNTKSLEFYNSINRNDQPFDQLVGLKLPENSGDKIMIRFRDGQDLDALHILSEGHIRCLGLAILLAKNVQDNLPIIIFDDVVNAIDDEHRRGIVETILEHQDIKIKQLIITTHGEEFMKQLENSISPKEYSKKVTRIDFIESNDQKKITIKLDLPRNYLMVARRRLEEGQVRDSLANMRRGFENLINTLWIRIAKKYNVQLSVSMRSPGRPPELMSTVHALRGYISKNEIEIYSALIPLFDEMLGKQQKYPVEWSYLNKGTHDEERKEDFDKSVVKAILEILEEASDIIIKN